MNAIEKDKYLREKFNGKPISDPFPKPIKKTKLVVFDFDETLVHSKEMFDNVNRTAMIKLNLPFTEEVAKNTFTIVQTKYIGWGKDLEEQKHIFRTKFNDTVVKLCNQEEFLNQVRFYDGIREVIKQLAKTDIILAIASSRDLYSILKFLKRERMRSYFNIVEATEGGKHFKDKPHPQIVNYISQELGIPLEKSVMIGDTSGDVKMGQSAGMKTIGIGYGKFTSTEKMKEYSPDKIIQSTDDIKNIPEIIKSLINER